MAGEKNLCFEDAGPRTIRSPLEKIISGGQTGVDRAALDIAISFGISHGGWVPKSRKAEDGVIPGRYKVTEMPTDSYSMRTEQNVIASDGTLIISRGALTEGSALTRKLAIRHKRPLLHININKTGIFEASKTITRWLSVYGIKTLNVAGPRAGSEPGIYEVALGILKAVLCRQRGRDSRA